MSTAILFPTSNSTPTYDSVVEPPQQSQQQQQQQLQYDGTEKEQQQQQQQKPQKDEHESHTTVTKGTEDGEHILSETTISTALLSASASAAVTNDANDANGTHGTNSNYATTAATTHTPSQSSSEVAATAIAAADDPHPPMTTTGTTSTTMSCSDNNENDCSSHTNNNGSHCNATTTTATTTTTTTISTSTTTTTTTTSNSNSNALVLYNPSPNPVEVIMNDATTASTSLPLSSVINSTTANDDTTNTAPNASVNTPNYKGLPNLGNTCYLNSAVQMLYSVDSFVSQLIDHYSASESNHVDLGNNKKNTREENQKESEDGDNGTGQGDGDGDNNNNNLNVNNNAITDNKSKKNELSDSFPLHCALANLFASMRTNTTATATANTTSSPTTSSFLPSYTTASTATTGAGAVPFSSMQQFKNVVDLQMPQFVGYWQQDSHEFLSTLLDLLHDEVVNYHKKMKEEEENEKDIEDTFHDDEVMVEKDGENDDNGDNDGDDIEKMDVDTTTDCITDLVATNTSTVSAQQPEQKENGVVEKDGYVIVNSQHQQSNKKARLAPDGRTSAIAETEEHNNNDNDSMTKVPSFSQLKLEEISVLLHGSAKDSEKIGIDKRLLHKKKGVEQQQEMHRPQNSCNRSAPNNVNCNVKKLIGGRISYDGIKNSSTPSSPLIELKMTNGPMFIEDITLGPQQHEDVPSSFHNEEDNNIDNDNGSSTESRNQIQQQPDSITSPSSEESAVCCSPTLVDTFFTMEVQTCLTCDSCNFSRSRKETFRHLSIEVGDADDESLITSTIASLHQSHYDRTVQEGIRKFFSDEKLELKCEKCFGESATQSKEIVRLPKILILHLKRFIVDVSPDYTSVSYRKNRVAVEFDEHLSLDQEDPLGEYLATDVNFPAVSEDSEKDDVLMGDGDECKNDDDEYEILEPTVGEIEDGDDDMVEKDGFVDLGMMKRKFKIRSVINHIGSSASCGHYTANAFRLNKDKDQTKDDFRGWVKFNDAFVSNISKEEAMGEQTQKSAYLLMYEFE